MSDDNRDDSGHPDHKIDDTLRNEISEPQMYAIIIE